MKRLLIAIQTGLVLWSMASQPAMAAPDTANGVFEGEIGEQMIRACLDEHGRSAYYYLRDQQEVTLDGKGEDWQESANGTLRARWHITVPDTNAYRRVGLRTDVQTGKTQPISLMWYGSNEDQLAPCARTFYQPRLQAPVDARPRAGVPALAMPAEGHKVAAGTHHTAVVDGDGRLWMWGSNVWGQLGDGSKVDRHHPVLIGDGYAQVFAGDDKTAAIKRDGSLWVWMDVRNVTEHGYNFNFLPRQIGLGFAQVAAERSGASLLAVGQDGSLWGYYLPDAKSRNPLLFNIGDGVVRAILGTTGSNTGYAIALKADGTVWAWAYDGNLPIDHPMNLQRKEPLKVGEDFVDLQSSWHRAIGKKKDGSLWEWHAEGAWQQSNGEPRLLTVQAAQALNLPYEVLVPGIGQDFALDKAGKLWAWGRPGHTYVPLGNGALESTGKPVLVGEHFSQIAVGEQHAVAMKVDGSVWFWGAHGRPGEGSAELNLGPRQIGDEFALVKTGPRHTMAIKRDGSLWAWGSNSKGQIGMGKAGANVTTPQKIGLRFAEMALGSAHSLAIKRDHSLWAWGDNTKGQLGDGTLINRSKPVRIGSGFVRLAARGNMSLALKSDGSLWVWGSENEERELSQDIFVPGTMPKRLHLPIRLGGEFASIVTSQSSTMAIGRDGRLWEWKGNTFEVRKQWSKHSHRPALVGAGYVSVAVGNGRHYGIKADGSLWAWGTTYGGYLGNGAGHSMSPDLLEPVRIGSDFVQVATADRGASGGEHSLAVKRDGSLWAWGANDSGQLGDQLEQRRTQRVPVQIGSGFAQVSVYGQHSLALKRDGSLWGWGDSHEGQLGAGVSVPLRPMKVVLPAGAP